MSESIPRAVVVNDDTTQLKLLAALVRKAGLEPACYEDAESALAGMRGGPPPALVVTDVHMPGLDGWRFCRVLRSHEYRALNGVPILLVSAIFEGEEAMRIAADLGAEGFMAVPVDGARFIEQVHAILRGEKKRTTWRALLVEDDESFAGLLGRAFTANGYQADVVHTVRAAAESFARNVYDLAVLDYHLPDGTGDALLDWFRAERPDCACIMVTGDLDPDLALDWMKRGAAAYLHKPYEIGYLLELCARARREQALLRVPTLLEQRTEQLRQSEEQLRKSERRVRALLDNVPVGLAAVDVETKSFVAANRTFCDMFGYAAEDVVGQTPALLHGPAEWPRAQAEYSRMCAGASSQAADLSARRKDGAELSIDVRCGGAEIDGRVCRLFAYADSGERKRAEAERESLRLRLAHARKMESIGRLAGAVAHDFNNMLAVILGNVEMVLENVPTGQIARAELEEARKAARRSTRLTDQLLALACRQAAAPQAVDVDEAVGQLEDMLRRLVGGRGTLEWRPGGGGTVRIDPAQIEQMLVALCENARDAVEGAGSIAVETCVRELGAADVAALGADSPGRYARIAVRDDGTGMDAAAKEHLFEPFFTTKPPGQGIGLGLATVYGIAKQNGGVVTVESAPREGTEVAVFLPLHAAAAAKAPPPAAQGQAPSATGRQTILLVEDERAILGMVRHLLERKGFDVLAAESPAEALSLSEAHAGRIDLLLTDVVMPGMNGRDLATRLTQARPDVKCLFMSGHTADLLHQQGVLGAGAPFVQKPFTIRALSDKIREALGGA